MSLWTRGLLHILPVGTSGFITYFLFKCLNNSTVKMPAMKNLYSRTAALRGIYHINVVSSLKHRENNVLSNVSSLLQTVSLKHTQSQNYDVNIKRQILTNKRTHLIIYAQLQNKNTRTCVCVFTSFPTNPYLNI